MNIFRPHNFPLASGNTDNAPVNHPDLVKTNNRSSFCSNFSSFTSADALRSSDISPVPELNPHPRGGTAKKMTSSPYNKYFEVTQKEKIEQTTKSKT
jgi:hypothetical protein